MVTADLDDKPLRDCSTKYFRKIFFCRRGSKIYANTYEIFNQQGKTSYFIQLHHIVS